MASRRNVEFRMSARDDTARGVRSVQRRFRGLGRSIAGVFVGNVLARGVEEFARRVIGAFNDIQRARVEGAFDEEAEGFRRLRGESEEAIQTTRDYVRITEGAQEETKSLGERISDLWQRYVVGGEKAFKIIGETGAALITGEKALSDNVNTLVNVARGAERVERATISTAEAQRLVTASLKEQDEAQRNLIQGINDARTAYQELLSDLQLIAAEERRRSAAGAGDRGGDIRRRDPGFSDKGPAQQLLEDERSRQATKALGRVRDTLGSQDRSEVVEALLQRQIDIALSMQRSLERGGFGSFQ